MPDQKPTSKSKVQPVADSEATMSEANASIDTSRTAAPASKVAAETPVPKTFGRYKIEKELGKGAMGVVYLAEDTQIGRKVALKIPRKSSLEDAEALERFYREARTTGTLRHNNICPVYDVGAIDGVHYLTMAYIPGKPVSSFVSKDKFPAAKQVALLIRKIALALAEAHRNGVIHRDLKPSNVMLDDRGEPIVMDFGLARQMNNVENARLTQSGAILGTPAYMAPEQVRGEADGIGPQADIYALGVMMYQFLTGELPFSGPIMMVFAQILTAQPARPSQLRPEVDPTLEAICLKMMAKDTSQRYAGMNDVADDLTEYIKKGTVAGLKAAPLAAPELESEPNFENLPSLTEVADAPRPRRKPRKSKTPAYFGLKKPQRILAAAGGALALVLIVYFAVTILLKSKDGKQTVAVQIDDPTAVVKIDGDIVTIDGKGTGQVKLTVGTHEFSVERGDQIVRNPEKFEVNKGNNRPLVITVNKNELDDGAVSTAALPAEYQNSLGMEFVRVPKGKSWLGGGGGKHGETEVEIAEDFYLGKYEVTQDEWEKVTGSNPSHFSRNGGGKDKVKDISDEELKRFPANAITWEDAQGFLARLNTVVKEPGWMYRLPTEEEWEYACRGGPMTDRFQSSFHYYLDKPTNSLLPDQANFDDSKELQRICQVGSYKPNRLGLYDMHGNVFEWCSDKFLPTDSARASFRVCRGGGWNSGAPHCCAALRWGYGPMDPRDNVGLRLVRVPVGKEIIKITTPEEKKPAVETKSTPTFKNSLGMEFVLVPRGKSWLGGGGGNVGDKEVEIKEDFYLGKYEVTQEEWEKVTGKNPSHFSRAGGGKDAVKDIPDADLKRFPADNVSREDAKLFVEQLNARCKEAGWEYRVPREVEWEYACRGGPSENKLDYGFDFYFDKPDKELLKSQANFGYTQGLMRTQKVGSYEPNRLGLYDMHGNLFEWCDDPGKTAAGASQRMLRGGSWGSFQSEYCKAGFRLDNPMWNKEFYSGRTFYAGLRVARVPVGKEIVTLATKPVTESTVVPLKLLAQHPADFVFTTAISPDGKLVAGGNNKGTKVWDADTGAVVSELQIGSVNAPRTLAFTPDSKYLAWGGWNQELHLYDPKTGAKVRTFQGNEGFVVSLCFSADGNRLLTGSQGRTAGNGFLFSQGPNTRIWNVETGKELRKFDTGGNVSVGGHWLADDRRAVSRDGSASLVRLWDTETGKEERIFSQDLPEIWTVSLSPNNKYVAAGLKNVVVLVWDVTTGQQIQRFESAANPRFTPDGERILCSTGEGASLRMWDVKSGAELLRVVEKLPDGVGTIHIFSKGDRALISTYQSGHVYTLPLTVPKATAGIVPARADVPAFPVGAVYKGTWRFFRAGK